MPKSPNIKNWGFKIF